MMTMNFDMNASNLSTTSAFTPLNSNAIHDVVFNGLEFSQSKDGKWEFMRIKFGNDNGSYTDTSFGFKPDATVRKKTQWGENPSEYESFMLKVQHLLREVAPALEKQMMDGEVVFTPKKTTDSIFKQYVTFIGSLLDAYKGATVKIKLVTNNKGEACFPPFFASVNKDGKAYRKTNFIGQHLSFTDKELEAIKTATSAKPTVMPDTTDDMSLGGTFETVSPSNNLDGINEVSLD